MIYRAKPKQNYTETNYYLTNFSDDNRDYTLIIFCVKEFSITAPFTNKDGSFVHSNLSFRNEVNGYL